MQLDGRLCVMTANSRTSPPMYWPIHLPCTMPIKSSFAAIHANCMLHRQKGTAQRASLGTKLVSVLRCFGTMVTQVNRCSCHGNHVIDAR